MRALAGTKLAQDNDRDSIPALTEALASEKVAQTKVNLASALARLGEGKGIVALNSICQDASEQPYIRSDAARLVLDATKESAGCLNAMIDLLQHGNVDTQMSAAELLPKFHDLSSEASHRVCEVLIKALKAKDGPVRHTVSHALGKLRDPSAIPYLQTALDTEQDKSVRSEMQADLQKLEQQSKKAEP